MIQYKICKRKFKNSYGLSNHIRMHKLTIVEYFTKYDIQFIECEICKEPKLAIQKKTCRNHICRKYLICISNYKNKIRKDNDIFKLFDPEKIHLEV